VRIGWSVVFDMCYMVFKCVHGVFWLCVVCCVLCLCVGQAGACRGGLGFQYTDPRVLR
jgi:hypothetical protein